MRAVVHTLPCLTIAGCTLNLAEFACPSLVALTISNVSPLEIHSSVHRRRVEPRLIEKSVRIGQRRRTRKFANLYQRKELHLSVCETLIGTHWTRTTPRTRTRRLSRAIVTNHSGWQDGAVFVGRTLAQCEFRNVVLKFQRLGSAHGRARAQRHVVENLQQTRADAIFILWRSDARPADSTTSLAPAPYATVFTGVPGLTDADTGFSDRIGTARALHPQRLDRARTLFGTRRTDPFVFTGAHRIVQRVLSQRIVPRSL